MKRFRSILVVVSGKDGGKAAVDQAETLATRNFAKIKLVDAIESLPGFLDVAGTEPAERHRELVKNRLAKLVRLATPLRESGLSVDTELLEGNLAEKAIERVITDRHDLLIKSADQAEGLSQRIFGTTGHRLLRKCPCPVWIIKSHPEFRLNRILVAVDPIPLDKNRDPMNVRIMELGTSLAMQNRCELHVVYVWPPWTQWDMSQIDRDSSPSIVRDVRASDSLQERMLEKLIAPFREEATLMHTHLLKGDPGDTISSLCHSLGADLLVMGTICRRKFVVFTIGNTAEQVFDRVRCSVLAVKPDEFLPSVFPQAVDGSTGISFA